MAIGLEEDSASFDWTARAASQARGSSNEKECTATLISKDTGIWAGETGLRALAILSHEMGSPIKIQNFVKNGESVSPKQEICTWTGTADSIVTFERTYINLASYVSGIATQTHQFIKKVNAKNFKNPPRITATRKTLPGYRELAIQATLLAGAHPHRFNLSGGMLLKENHIAAAGGIAKAVKNARQVVPHVLKIEIEVRNLDELKEAITAGAEVIMLDNFTPSLIQQAMPLKPSSGVTYEASGGINLSNLDSYLIEGLDVISVGSITHSITALDLSLLMNDH